MSNIETVMISKAVLGKLIDMAMQHTKDIESGITEGIYAASENQDIGAKCAAIEAAQKLYSEDSSTSVLTPEAFQHKVDCCINSMLQDDARGQVQVFSRENGYLTVMNIAPEDVYLICPQQCEIILFDGGNSAGDSWKHLFFPKQLKDFFVDEIPLSVAPPVVSPLPEHLQQRKAAIETELARLGYRMERSLSVLDGSGHTVVDIETGEMVEDDLSDNVCELALEWTVLEGPVVGEEAEALAKKLKLPGWDSIFTDSDIADIGHVMVQDLVGDYDTPDGVPEWQWLEENASYAHVHNGDTGGVWEFILNMARDFKGIPAKLQPAFSEAKAKDLAYVVFHQGN